jgi:riboflavin biosynthesis pyrimidine reductase
VVFTSRVLHSQGADIRFVQETLPVHQQMQAASGGKNIWLVGGGELVGQFYDSGLLDELIVQVGSVTLGAQATSSATDRLPPTPATLGATVWTWVRGVALRGALIHDPPQGQFLRSSASEHELQAR